MAQEEAQKSADVVTVATTDKEVTVPAPVPEKEVTAPVASAEEKAVPEKEEKVTSEEAEAEKSVPVKEEETVVAEKVIAPSPEELEKKALEEFKELVREALNKREFTPPPPPVKAEKTEEKKPAEEETKGEEKTEEAVKIEEKSSDDVATEETKPEEKSSDDVAPPETKSEEKAAVPATEKASGAEEDGTKTVEAIEESIVSVTPPEETTVVAEPEPVEPEEVSIYGVPLLQDERSDTILLKFLRARDFKVKEALTMLKNTVQWRKDNKIDDLLESESGEEASEFEKMVFAHGVDKEGHVVIYSSYGEFQNKELFSDKEKLNKFLNWRIQLQEKCVRALDFSSPDAKSSFVFVSDFRNAPGLGKRALWQFIRRAVKQFEDNYPEFATRELFINVPWWYIPYYKTFGSIITSPRTRSKMVLAGPAKSADTIFKYIAPEQVPVKYGGLSDDIGGTVTDAIVKPAAKYTIELPASEACTLSWELRVLGADVTYGAQFEPTAEGSYDVIVSKNRKIGLTDEPVITGSFKVGEPGKIVITIDNQTSKKKKVLYRFKSQPRSDI
ncbi:Patellin-1 [Raphanus sativus]|uniref:Patellin-1 n=1 Tax=Raphanus sativus TaxID=3726 RepID=A0A6J0MHH7_RAPSA|nr:patellin-1 [Raphanus sativus]KAJ4909463.1 Patellin-1 [Raphanus sativus]